VVGLVAAVCCCRSRRLTLNDLWLIVKGHLESSDAFTGMGATSSSLVKGRDEVISHSRIESHSASRPARSVLSSTVLWALKIMTALLLATGCWS
jgi:hypothetical protein